MMVMARKELRDALRNHWLQGYTLLLATLGLVAALTSVRGAAGLGFQSFGRTAASLTNLCLMLAPLVALALGAAAIAGERDGGTLGRLLAQPLTRRELLLGKYVGLLGSLILATVIGFLPAGVVVATTGGAAMLGRYLVFPGLASLVICALLGLGVLISVRSRTGAQAQARAVFLWFAFVLLYDLLLMGTLMAASMQPPVLVGLLLLNPVSAGRLLVVLCLEADLYLLGPAGAWLVETMSPAGAAALLLASLVAWAVASLLLALRAFGLGGSDRAAGRARGRRRIWRAVTERISRRRSTTPATLERARTP